jgi:tRNA pseudouridine32 synthase/23S rRNA pseudouridine746 synthase
MKFQNREVIKTYECLAPLPEDNTSGLTLEFPLLHRSRIVKERHVLQAHEVAGTPNSQTLIEFAGPYSGKYSSAEGIGLYRLHPKTGKTHQLRVHMNSIGLPIVGDDLYPTVVDRPYDDFSSPLQLVATRLEMTDPISGEEWDFRSKCGFDALG